MAISIPEVAREPLRLLATMTAVDRQKLVESLMAAKPRSSLVAFVDSLQAEVNLDHEQLNSVVANLTGMYNVMNKRGESPEAFAAKIKLSMQTAFSGSEAIEIPEDFEGFLARALANANTLGIVGKSLELILADERIYESARLTTNLRPIFTSGNPHAPTAVLAIHSLTIELQDSDEKVVIALDDQDLTDLGAELMRAQQEAGAVRAFSESAGLAWLER
jgi:hypothetical protein